jgi:Aldo/keto reductase family
VDEAIRLVHEAIDAGVTFFDNCWEYYNGKTENILGRALRGRRDKVFLMTKVCTLTGQPVRAALEQGPIPPDYQRRARRKEHAMSCLKRCGLGLSVVVAVTGTVLILGCGRERPGGGSGGEAMTEGAPQQATGKAPQLPQAGPLASPRSLHQVGLPTELTRKAIPHDNPQTP